MNILVTGGAGFLGQNLVKRCAEHGHGVSIIDLKPSQFPVHKVDRYCRRIIYGVDITAPGEWTKHFAKVDAVFHLAGLISFWRKAKDSLMRVNVEGTKNVLSASIDAGVSKFVHISSVAAIGFDGHKKCPIDETFAFDWATVRNKHYMMSKHLAEAEVLGACQRGLNATIVNPGLMWGPGDMVNSSKLIVAMKNARIPACPPGGTNIVDVRDVAHGLLSFIEHGERGQRYILGGQNLSFREVYRITAAAVGVAPPKIMLPSIARGVIYLSCLINEQLRSVQPPLTSDHVDSSFMVRYFSSAKAERELGWRTKFAFEDTIRDSVAWLKSHGHLN